VLQCVAEFCNALQFQCVAVCCVRSQNSLVEGPRTSKKAIRDPQKLESLVSNKLLETLFFSSTYLRL